MRRPKYYTVPQAMEAALWCHYCNDHKEADKILRNVLQYVLRETDSGQGR